MCDCMCSCACMCANVFFVSKSRYTGETAEEKDVVYALEKDVV